LDLSRLPSLVTSPGIPVRVSVVIPTTCEHARSALLMRAIDSVLSQTGVEVELVVVVNGNLLDRLIFESLRSMPGLIVQYKLEPGAQLACRHGLSQATGEFVSFLDDDDELLSGALALRARALTEDSSLDFVVTNGFRGPGTNPVLVQTQGIRQNPLTALLDQNWMASCGGMFRRSTCGDEYFAGLPRYTEWTVLAYRLMLAGKQMSFIDVPTYRINDTPDSASKSPEFRRASIEVLEQLLALPLPTPVRARLRGRMSVARHEVSVMDLENGNLHAAWRHHLLSLTAPAGWRYLPYTRHLLLRRARR
jgi:glycosyltransferase involved in cell wall biosynthesis